MAENHVYKPELLIIDSDEAVREVMHDLLSVHFSITCAKDREEGISKLKGNDYSFLIVDSAIFGVSDFEFIREAKEIRPYLQFVILSSDQSPENEVRALKAGAMEYIRKPFTVEEIALLLEKFRSVSVHKKEEYDFVNAITEEKRTFCLPTNMEILNVFIHELLEILKRFGLRDKNQTFSIRLSIYEMLINAYEHGNLEIDFDQKKSLLEKDINYLDYLRKRSLQEPYKDRKIWVTYTYKNDIITLTIRDEGKGFNFRKYKDSKRVPDVSAVHGRGIFITRVNMDQLTYNELGNEVTMIKEINKNE